MSRRVVKFVLEWAGLTTIRAPEGALIVLVDVEVQGETESSLCAWIEVETEGVADAWLVERRFRVYRTDQAFLDSRQVHVASVLIPGTWERAHVYEVLA